MIKILEDVIITNNNNFDYTKLNKNNILDCRFSSKYISYLEQGNDEEAYDYIINLAKSVGADLDKKISKLIKEIFDEQKYKIIHKDYDIDIFEYVYSLDTIDFEWSEGWIDADNGIYNSEYDISDSDDIRCVIHNLEIRRDAYHKLLNAHKTKII